MPWVLLLVQKSLLLANKWRHKYVILCIEAHKTSQCSKQQLKVDWSFIWSRNIITDYYWLPYWKCTVNFVLLIQKWVTHDRSLAQQLHTHNCSLTAGSFRFTGRGFGSICVGLLTAVGVFFWLATLYDSNTRLYVLNKHSH